LIFSPVCTNSGTRTTAPVSRVAGLPHHEIGRLHRDGLTVPQGDVTDVLLLDPLHRLTHGIGVGLNLLEGFRVHEVPVLAVVVEVLQILVQHVGRFHTLARLEGLLQHPPRLQVAQLHPVEGLPLARLDKFVFDDDAGIAVEKELESAPKFVGTIGRHGLLSLMG